jgi:putative peptidoglycan lipid II flippase
LLQGFASIKPNTMSRLNNFIKKIITAEDSVSQATVIVFITYILSSVLGLVRNRVLAGVYGDSVELGIYYMSDKLPSFIYSTLVLTIITAAFIPVFTEIHKKSREKALNFTSDILSFSVLTYTFIAAIVFIFARPFSVLVSWGSLDEASLTLMASLMRIILISQLTLIISGYLSSFLHAYKRFLLPSLIPIIYNFGVIFGILFFSNSYGIYAPAIGMFLGTVGAVLIQIPLAVYFGFKYRPKIKLLTPEVRQAIKVGAPRMLAIFAQRFYILAIGGFISKTYLSPSYLVVYEFANQLQTMPVNAFGVSISQALFPTMSAYAVEKQAKKVGQILNRYILRMTYFMLPIVMMFFILRIPLVRILFGGDRFSWLGTNLTAYTLAFFAISMWFQSLSMILTKVFYAFKNSKIPTIANIAGLFVSFLFWWVFAVYMELGVWSLALAFSFGAVLNAIILFIYVKKLIGNFFKESYLSYVKIFYATILCGIVTYAVLKFLDTLVFDTTRTLSLVILTTIILCLGILVYVITLEILGVKYGRTMFNKALKLIVAR